MSAGYDHEIDTTFTREECERFVGYSARLPLTGRIVGVGEGEHGPYVLFKPDERWGLGDTRFGVDVEALDRVSEAPRV